MLEAYLTRSMRGMCSMEGPCRLSMQQRSKDAASEKLSNLITKTRLSARAAQNHHLIVFKQTPIN